MRRLVLYAIAASVAGLVFAWGFLSHRHQVFPYALVSRLLPDATVQPRDPSRTLLAPRTPRLDTVLALPYVSGTLVSDPESRGVIFHEPSRSEPGLNLYCSRREAQAYLVSNTGKVAHRWRYPGSAWQHVHLLPGGDLLAIVKDERLLRLDKKSRLIWESPGAFHHDLWVDEANGQIWALTREQRDDRTIHPAYPTLTDTITVLSPEGKVERVIDVLACLRSSPWRGLLQSVYHRTDLEASSGEPVLDLLHTNHIEKITTKIDRLPEAFRPGNLILSIRQLNAVAVLDPKSEAIVWLWGPNNLTLQHHPVLLDNGNLLMFDNGLEQSRVLELDPVTLQIVWQYGPVEEFFSKTRGSNQRLSNGNTLITESDEGRAFEVTAAGEIVWEFRNHDVDEEGKRGAIFRVERFQPEDLLFLSGPLVAGSVHVP